MLPSNQDILLLCTHENALLTSDQCLSELHDRNLLALVAIFTRALKAYCNALLVCRIHGNSSNVVGCECSIDICSCDTKIKFFNYFTFKE